VVEGRKELDTKVSVKSGDEIGELARSFNQLMDYLKNSERKYRRIFEGSKDTILVADCNGFIQDINPAGLELFGCKDKSRLMKEKTLYDLFLRKEESLEFIGEMEKKGYVKDYETKMEGIDGRVIDVLITANFRRDEDGAVCGYESIVKDITEWKKVQERMMEADRLASIGQLAAGLAHEINNPLGIIKGFTGILLKRTSENDPARSDLQMINTNVDACKRIVEDLLKFSRRTETKPESININNLIDEVLDLFSYKFEEKGISVLRNYGAGIPDIMVDVEKMRQVLINVVMNAFQAIDGEGVIAVETSFDVEGRRLILSISDNGVGIPEDIMGKVFEPFFTTKEPGEGTGLGLSVSYGIVKEHGGDIIVESREGRGSRFIIQLPYKGWGNK
jgi:PAS domain S-box-containing protein